MQYFPLNLILATKPENFTNFPELDERILRHFSGTISSCYFFGYARWSNWLTRADVTEIILVAHFRRQFFLARETSANKTPDALAGKHLNEWVLRTIWAHGTE